MLEQGRILGSYRIDGVLGRGGMGVVYEAMQIPLRRTVALKILGADVSADSAFRERFRHEGLIQASLDHPNIVTVFEGGELEGHLFIAMRLVRGPTLKDLSASGLEPARALRLLGPVADALDVAHAAGLIHRDIKPQNILVGPGDHPYLADFGLTKTTGAPGLTQAGQFVGTVDYSAPEQIRGGAVCARTDVYALGAVLYEALTGRVPYPRDTDVAVLYAHMTDAPPRVSEHRPNLPRALDDVIASAMAKSPDNRPASAADLLHSAKRVLGIASQIAERPPATAMVEPGADTSPAAPTRAVEPHLTVPAAPKPAVQAPKPVTAAASAAPRPARRPETVSTPTAKPSPPAPLAPTKPTSERARRGLPRGSPAWIAIAPVMLALGAAGYASGRSRSPNEKPEPATPVAVAGIELHVPAEWTRTRAPKLPGLDFSRSVTIAPSGRSARGLVLGVLKDATGPDLLPAALARRPRPDGEPVRLGRLQALRYRRLRPAASELAVTLFVVPAADGSVVVACYAPAVAPPSTGDDCEGAATTLRVSSVTYGLGPVPAYGTKLKDVLTTLDGDRRMWRRLLASAVPRATQSSRARELSTAFGKAARDARTLSVSARDREAHDELVRALGAARDSYERMALAAGDGRSPRFDSAARDVRLAEAAVVAGLARLRRLGYSS